VDTDFGGALSFRHSVIQDHPDDVVVEMADFKEDEENKRTVSDASKARLRSKINAKGGFRAGSKGSKKNDFDNINRYVIDDDDEDDT